MCVNKKNKFNFLSTILSWGLIIFILLTAGCKRGILLPGDPDNLARDMIYNLDTGKEFTETDISIDPDGREIVRNCIEVILREHATVSQVNELLRSIDGQIISMLEGRLALAIQIPDPGKLDALEQIISRIGKNPIVRRIRKGYIPQPQVLPDIWQPPGEIPDYSYIDHHLAIRAHAAWNAKSAIPPNENERAKIIVVDHFGGGHPDAAFDIFEPYCCYSPGRPSEHGYGVLSVIAATFNGVQNLVRERDLATGIFPGTCKVRIMDISYRTIFLLQNSLLVNIIQADPNDTIVVNHSMGDLFYTTSEQIARQDAIEWIRKVRGYQDWHSFSPGSLESKFIHVVAAGNHVPDWPIWEAAYTSAFTAAALLELVDEDGIPVENLTNTLVIENRKNSPTPPYVPIELNSESRIGGQLSAIGTDVWVLTGPAPSPDSSSTNAENRSGTSLSAPQVTGLIAYLCSIKSTLTPQRLIAILRVTASQMSDGAPVVDAYAAAQAMDTSRKSFIPTTNRLIAQLFQAPVRKAILDVTGTSSDPIPNQIFDERDIELFLWAFDNADGALDYSRYDLNGDGKTGGPTTAKFDLDIDSPPRYVESTSQIIRGEPLSFDETDLTDLDILCYYAYSPLYLGDTNERDNLLEDCCGPTIKSITPSELTLGRRTWVRIEGRNMINVNSVTLDRVASVQNLRVTRRQGEEDVLITAFITVPIEEATGPARVSVHTDQGDASGRITLTNPGAPTISRVVPFYWMPGDPLYWWIGRTLSLQITGENLQGAYEASLDREFAYSGVNEQSPDLVWIDNVIVPIWDSTGEMQSGGIVTLTVRTPQGSAAAWAPLYGGPLTVVDVNPTGIKYNFGTRLRIRGTNLIGATYSADFTMTGPYGGCWQPYYYNSEGTEMHISLCHFLPEGGQGNITISNGFGSVTFPVTLLPAGSQ
ncbi:MAG: S8/S53 family peptidase [Candidatus Aminicenantes bacterium]|nr:MAG: S8/S53 family peptidase [Candidatus Aminicenantes bacterium]